MPQPDEFGGAWETDSRRIDVVYRRFEPEIPLRAFVDDLVPLLPARNSPITRQKTGVQGYLFAIPPKAGQLICERVEFVAPAEEAIAETLVQAVPDEATRQALIQARLGQGRWRRDLLRHWSGRCAITGLELAALLRASHIKPWRASDNRERLDMFNGLLLCPAYGAAFDAGLIGFIDDGSVAISPQLPTNQLLAAGISKSVVQLSNLGDAHRAYLAYHRENVFQPA